MSPRGGVYHHGKAGGAYVDEAFSELIEKRDTKFKAIGSSLGAYAAVKFVIKHKFCTGIAILPHFDLRSAQEYCGREAWINWSIQGTGKVSRTNV